MGSIVECDISVDSKEVRSTSAIASLILHSRHRFHTQETREVLTHLRNKLTDHRSGYT